MLFYLTLIFCCQLVGELTTLTFDIPVPGPVVGMVLLFGWLLYKNDVAEDLARVTDGLLSHLSLLFVPAGVGVMLHFRLLEDDGLAIGLALVGSTVLTVVVTALLMSWLAPKAKPAGAKGQEGRRHE